MRTAWMRRRAVARGAVTALAIGLALLAGLAVVNTRSSANALTSIAAAQEHSRQWGDVYLKLSIEYEQLNDFVRAESDVGKQPLISSIGSAEANLRWLVANGDTADIAEARALQNTYGGYSYTLRELIDADRRGDRAEVLLDAEQAALSASALRKQASVNIARNSLELSGVLRAAERTNRRILVAVGITSAIDLLLVSLSTLVLLAYQRGTERQAEESRHRAQHDGLTGAANRSLLHERVDEALARCDRDSDVGVGLLLLDLNRFKEVNDTLGHHAGDELLKEVASRLTAAARRNDLVARLGGDEFAMLLPGVPDERTAVDLAERVHTALCGPATVDGVVVDVSGSIGVSRYPGPSADAGELLQHADIAMYTAKRGRLGVAFYRPDTDRHTSGQLTLAVELRTAIEQGGLRVHYQPKVRGGSHVPCGVKALVRWQHPVRGLLPPEQFLPVAEQNGLVVALTDAVLEAALAQHRAWRDEGMELPVAVDVGTACALDAGFPARVAALLDRYGVAPGALTLELTEKALAADGLTGDAPGVPAALHGLGVRLAIDDFGAGYAAMGHLGSLPLDELKIDSLFTAGVRTAGAGGRAVVAAIVELAHALALDVVVEGVEDEALCEVVDGLGADVLQGSLFSDPLPAADLATWLRARGGVPAPA